MNEPWDDISSWWMDAVRHDPRDSTDLLDVLDEVIADTAGLTLDVGCGEGQVMRHVGPPIVGTDLSVRLLERARQDGPVVRARLPDLGWVRSGSFDRAICVGVLELLDDHRSFFAEIASVVHRGGTLVVVMNHPVVTAPDSEPLVDAAGRVLWHWGRYLHGGRSNQHVDDRPIVLHHRPLGDLLGAAADAGWRLELLVERGVSRATVAQFPEYGGQEEIPSVLGCRWRRDR